MRFWRLLREFCRVPLGFVIALRTPRIDPISDLETPITPENENLPHEPGENGRPYEFHPSKWGFYLGGVVLGAAGCILGACLHYEYPVSVTISILWWGIYLGCLGASIGALFGLCRDGAPASPSRSKSVITAGAAGNEYSAPRRPRSFPAAPQAVGLHNKAGDHTPRFAAAREYVGSASSHFTSPEGP